MAGLSFLVALLAGALTTVQAGSNSALKQALNQPIAAMVMNYLVGMTGISLYALLTRVSPPTTEQYSSAPWWAWLGGLAGAIYGLVVVLLAQQLGAATLTALLVTGQLLSSVALDHFGAMGFDPHPAGLGRIAGCVLMLAGLFLIAKF